VAEGEHTPEILWNSIFDHEVDERSQVVAALVHAAGQA